jgi:hypothetical protein
MLRRSYNYVRLLDFAGYGGERGRNICAKERNCCNNGNRDETSNQAIFQGGDALTVAHQARQESKAVCEHGQVPFVAATPLNGPCGAFEENQL